jgi:hypothetical protein
MRVTRRKLIDLAHREAQRRADEDDVVSAYLIGSVARGEPLLGGAADIDLVLIHKNPPPAAREVVQLSEDIHLDIAHHDRVLYSEPRSLRTSPWLGPALYDPVFILDPEHFLEWAQASARSQFNRADYRLARASALLGRARTRLDRLNGQHTPAWTTGFTQIASDGANAVALLAGAPAAGRRLALTLKQRTAEAGQPEVFEAFLRLIGLGSTDGSDLADHVAAWARAFELVGPRSTDPRLSACRMRYHQAGFEALSQAGWPQAVEWGLLSTWQIAADAFDAIPNADEVRSEWEDFLRHLDLDEPASERRAGEAEGFLDRVEEILDVWAGEHGA